MQRASVVSLFAVGLILTGCGASDSEDGSGSDFTETSAADKSASQTDSATSGDGAESNSGTGDTGDTGDTAATSEDSTSTDTTTTTTTGDGDGDGDGDAATGDGDGDGDGDAATGDGDGDGDGDGASTGDGDGDGDGDGATTGDGDGDGDGDGGPPDCTNPSADATLDGVVYAPNGIIPVSGAVVYATDTPPTGIPDGVYCAECVTLTCGLEDFVYTNPDGTFTLDTVSGTDRYIVVQKGQFMRVTQMDVAVGAQTLSANDSTLPDQWNPPNEYIPRIAVADGSFDRIEDALGKMGLGDTAINGNIDEKLIPGTEPFDLYDNGRDPTSDGFASQGTLADLVADPSRLDDYHIIFVPCSGDGYTSAMDAIGVQNIRDWVEAGGRWYVADWAHEWMRTPFPEYQDFYLSGGSGDLGAYDSLATVLDGDMLTWLEQLPPGLKDINPLNDTATHPVIDSLPQLLTVDNWSGIQYPLPEVLVDDGMGGMVDVGHKVWLEGPGGGDVPVGDIHPLTVSGQFGCGRIQFTSYHAAEFEDYVGLTPQELVLMYTILEIGVCQEALPPPQ